VSDRVSSGVVSVRPMTAEDWEAVAAVYRAGIATANATFETDVPPYETWDADHHKELRLVAAEDSGNVVGWVAASPASDRCAYAGVVEHSVYVDPEHQGRGIGRLLLGALIDASEAAGIWTLQSGVFPENTASLALHRSCGFRAVGTRERIGQLDGAWRDVVWLERRSDRTG
jgi:L-amino acid N-acyltransferase YncA